MGLLDLFRKKDKSKNLTNKNNLQTKNNLMGKKVFEGTQFEREIITFEQRKKTAIPSARGLYPAEILLLEYCSKGLYPVEETKYPGFWWYSYGIKDVDKALASLANRNFIKLGEAKDSLQSCKVEEFKQLLSRKNISSSGKKADLIKRISDNFSNEELLASGIKVKYILTEDGRVELDENAYVPYMHKHHAKTSEDDTFGMTFNVWSINKILGTGDKSRWKAVVDEEEAKLYNGWKEKNDSHMEFMKKYDPKGNDVLKAQDEQIEACNRAREKYAEDKNLDEYIDFMENIMNNGGLKFEGSTWHFVLPDLYIKAKRYEDALNYCKRLKQDKPSYGSKADSYIAKIETKIQKERSK